jgi:hypothetical protein
MSKTDSTTTTFSPGTPEDSYAIFSVFEQTLADLNAWFGSSMPTSASDPASLTRMWAYRHSLYEYLAREASEFWLAMREERVTGFSRSTLHDGLRQLMELCSSRREIGVSDPT